jgi:hypothetical protein
MKPSLDWLLRHVVEGVTYSDESQQWFLVISDSVYLSIECPWQILTEQGVVLASGDHGQQYGLPAPIDASVRAKELLAGRAIRRVSLDEVSADLHIEFDGPLTIRTFNDSSGYEGWNLTGPQGERYIAQGGGNVVFLPAK